MDNLISRQAAIDALGDMVMNWTDSDYELGQLNQWKEDRKAIIDLPSAQPQRWIPVTERLPDDIRPVIVTWCNTDPASYYQYIVGKRFIGVAHYKSGKWYWYSSTTEDFLAEYGRYDGEEFDEAIEVLAWCEMPEPYKGEQE